MRKDDSRSKSGGVETAVKRRPSRSLESLLSAVLDEPERWMNTPSVQFGGRRPADLVGTDEEVKILDLLNAVDRGMS